MAKSFSGTGLRTSPAVTAVMAILCFILIVGCAVFFYRIFAPNPYEEVSRIAVRYNPDAMQQALSVEKISMRQDSITGFGSRMLGQEGMYRTAEMFREAYLSAGLEVYEHHVRTSAPLTEYREIFLLDSGGAETALTDVEIYPFLPNNLAPVATGKEGVTGRLLVITPETIRTRKNFDDCIGIIDADERNHDPDYGFFWVSYAKLGLKAIIVSHREGFDAIRWNKVCERFHGMVSSIPVNFPRLAATEEIFRYEGETVRVKVKNSFVNARNVSLFGVLRAKNPAREAIVVSCSYDACAVLPDRAYGVAYAVNPATQLQLLEGLLPYRESITRDVIFASFGGRVMADNGLDNLIRVLLDNTKSAESNRLLRALGISARSAAEANKRLKPLNERKQGNDDSLMVTTALFSLFGNPRFLDDPSTTDSLLDSRSSRQRDFFKEQFSYVLNTIVFDLSERLAKVRLEFARLTSEDYASPEFRAFMKVRRVYDNAVSAAGYSAVGMLKDHREYFDTYDVRERCRRRFQELVDYHRECGLQIEQEIKLATLFNGYSDIGVFEPNIIPAFVPGEKPQRLILDVSSKESQSGIATIYNQFTSAPATLGIDGLISLEPLNPVDHGGKCVAATSYNTPRTHVVYWAKFGYPAYSFVNLERSEAYEHHADPTDLPCMRDVESVKHCVSVIGETVLSVAHGSGRLVPVQYEEWSDVKLGGQVLVSGVGRSLVPNYPLSNAAIGNRHMELRAMGSLLGYYAGQILMTNPYGRYWLPHTASDFADWWRVWSFGRAHNPIAAGYDDDGRIIYMKNEGEDGQRLFKSVNVPIDNASSVSIVVFRASPISLLDLTNPQTMKDYTNVLAVNSQGLSKYNKECKFEGLGLRTVFLEPDERCYLQLQSGAPNNELVQVTRAFMLGIDSLGQERLREEIDGPGYLVDDNVYIHRVAQEIAQSMAYVNGRRIDLQNRYHMADDRTNLYHRRTLENIESSRHAGSFYEETKEIRKSVTYASLIHPVLRRSVMEAVIGILWYLGLLVPFVFFFEKLLFCYTDVRKQLVALGTIFIVVFLLLQLLHPAFQMVRSSLMILLGFIIILISGGIALLFSGKFKENLYELRRKQGKVAGAEVNTMGVVGSAFMLGLNNMHRRKMRTGLTSATLTLLTFVMICFTSVRNDVVDEDRPIGKAAYQGMLVRREKFEPVSKEEVFAFRNRFGDEFDVCERRVLIGRQNVQNKSKTRNPILKAIYQSAGTVRRVDFFSAIQLQHNDPLRDRIDLLTQNGWFVPEHDREGLGICPVIIPEKMADKLGIPVERVNAGGVKIEINGREFMVYGIFSSESLRSLHDLDGLDLLPFNIEQISTLINPKENITGVLAADDSPRIHPQDMVIVPMRNLFPEDPFWINTVLSVAISMPDVGYKDARNAIVSYMEQVAQPIYYGLDGIAYRGRRIRATTLAGFVDLLIPLIIAGLTVLNTMRGSVYERRDEIFVYNAVGIAPRYVFFMFFAEAFVYAVVGSVCGYLLSQGTGRILTVLNMTGGLNMTFASLSTIYASLTIIAAVVVSTYFPARSAMEIAAPAEESGWSLPDPEGDDLEFDLPFTFGNRDRLAVLIFFDRYLRDHGEGSAGRFFAGIPDVEVSTGVDMGGVSALMPQIVSPIWLKPFDLAVSQQMTISLPTDPETGQYKAHIWLHRLSGTREAWIRLNQGFVAQIRRQFLHWRAVKDDERSAMFAEAQDLLKKKYEG